MAIKIHEGQNISLGKFLLAYLYQALGLASLRIKHLHSTPKKISLSGPQWLLQHLLNATFESNICFTVSQTIMEVIHDRHVKGMKLALQTPQCESNKTNFMKFIKLFSDYKVLPLSMAPIYNRCFGPCQFRAIFPRKTPTTHAHLNAIQASFFTSTLLSYRIESTGKCYEYIGYQPNLAS